MTVKVFLVHRWRHGPYANGDMDSCDVRGVIFAADEVQAEELLATLGFKATERDHNGFKWGDPFLEELEDIETSAELPLFMRAEW